MLYVDEGDVLTSAGVAAGLDLCLHVVRRDHGARVAAHIARHTVIAPHREGGQAQFIELPLEADSGNGMRLETVREWALERLDLQLTVAELARQACVSPRTFARRFRSETGTTPLQWLLVQRVLRAQQMLESGSASVDEVARSCASPTPLPSATTSGARSAPRRPRTGAPSPEPKVRRTATVLRT